MSDTVARRNTVWLSVFLEGLVIVVLSGADPSPAFPQEVATVLRTSRVLDGRGRMLEGRDIVIRDGRSAEIVPSGLGSGERVYDLRSYTVLPGLIDTHVHLGWHFGPDGRVARGTEMPDRVMYATQNAHRMLEAGITTIQSLGGAEDGPVARASGRGVLPGPRVLTSLGSVSARTGGPDELWAAVGDCVDRGSQVIKIFGSEGIRIGGGITPRTGVAFSLWPTPVRGPRSGRLDLRCRSIVGPGLEAPDCGGLPPRRDAPRGSPLHRGT